MADANFSYIPKRLQMMIKRIDDFTINSVKLTPETVGSIGAGNTLTVSLPKNTLVDIESFTLHSLITIAGANTRVPCGECLLSRVDVDINGARHDSVALYGYLYQSMLNISCSTPHVRQRYINNLGPKPAQVNVSNLLTTDSAKEAGATWENNVATLNLTGIATVTPFDLTAIGTHLVTVIAQMRVDVAARFGVVDPGVTAATTTMAVEWNKQDHPVTTDVALLNTSLQAEYTALRALIGTALLPATAPGLYNLPIPTTEATMVPCTVGAISMIVSLYNFLMQLPGNPVLRQTPPLITQGSSQYFTVSNWLGMLGSLGVVDTSLTGEIKIHLTLAPNNILSADNATFSLSSNYFTIDSIDFADYSQTMYATLSAGMPLNYSFRRWVNNSLSNTATIAQHSFNLASSSVKRLWYTHQINTAATTRGLTANCHTTDYYRFMRDGGSGFYLMADNVRIPNYDIDAEHYGVYHLMKAINAQNNAQYDTIIESQNDYDVRKFLGCFSFMGDFGGEDPICGKNTMGAASTFTLTNNTAWTTAGTVMIFAETDSVLNVMPGQIVTVTH